MRGRLRRPAGRALLALAAVWGASAAAPAQNLRPDGVYVQLGGADDRVTAVTAGARWLLDWKPELLGLRFTTAVDASLSAWRARGIGGPEEAKTFGNLAVVPFVRHTFDDGRSPWFVEAGIGLSEVSPRYRTSDRRFSTRLNFSDNLAVGCRLGPRGELSLRLEHVSNGGFRKPNPGENFVHLRYAFAY